MPKSSFNSSYIGKQFRVNERIQSRTVRLIGADDEQLGIKSIEDALRLAKTEEFDLVEVAPNARPPPCKIMNFRNHLYKHNKLEAVLSPQTKNIAQAF